MKDLGKRFLGILGIIFCFVMILSLIAPGDAFCRGNGGSVGGGGSKSYSPPPTRAYTPAAPKASMGKPGAWGSKTVAPAEKPKWGESQKPTPTAAAPKTALAGKRDSAVPAKAPSKVDKAFAEKAKMKGTSFKNRNDAVKDFRAKNEAKFVNKFDREPAIRPSYIPQTTTVGGSSYTVIYNPGFGGYGYYGPGGSWIAYNMWADAIMMNAMMHNHGYYYGQPVIVTYSVWHWLGGFLLVCIVVGLVILGARLL